MIEVAILAFALSMDSFAVSICLGSKRTMKTASLAFIAGVYFGLFQGLMPLIGYLGGRGVFGWVEVYAPWIAFFLLFLIGSKMIYESRSKCTEEEISKITHKLLLILAVATSIDAMAAGFTLTVLNVNPLLACLTIGITTFFCSGLGVYIGTEKGTWLGSKAEMCGGIVLILIGLKILVF